MLIRRGGSRLRCEEISRTFERMSLYEYVRNGVLYSTLVKYAYSMTYINRPFAFPTSLSIFR